MGELGERLRERWRAFWFAPGSAANLGFCRFLFFGSFFFFYLETDFSAWAQVSPAFWMPIWLFRTLEVPVFSHETLVVLQRLWKLLLALGCIGLFTRVSTAASFFLGLYLLGLPHNFGKTAHADTLVVLVLGILALARCADRWSVDRAIRKSRGAMGEISTAHPEYTWPIRAVWMVMSLIFFAAGISKLRHSGLEWVASDSMSIMLIQSYYGIPNADPLTSWGLAVAQYGWLSRLMAGAAMVTELGYPLALISLRARWVLIPSAVLMQVGTRLLMGPSFDQYLICNVFWIPWDYVGRQVALRSPLKKIGATFSG